MFLKGCRYVSDPELFGRQDHWQMPAEFETRRAGDCEDHALWAWKKFLEIGEDARFTLGHWRRRYHAWVTLLGRPEPRVFESTQKPSPDVVASLRVADYAPELSIDRRARGWVHPAPGRPPARKFRLTGK